MSLHYLEHLAVWTWCTFHPGKRLDFAQLRKVTLNQKTNPEGEVSASRFGEYFDEVAKAMVTKETDRNQLARQTSAPPIKLSNSEHEHTKKLHPILPVLTKHDLFASQLHVD